MLKNTIVVSYLTYSLHDCKSEDRKTVMQSCSPQSCNLNINNFQFSTFHFLPPPRNQRFRSSQGEDRKKYQPFNRSTTMSGPNPCPLSCLARNKRIRLRLTSSARKASPQGEENNRSTIQPICFGLGWLRLFEPEEIGK